MLDVTKNRNNVHVSGNMLEEKELSPDLSKIVFGANQEEAASYINVVIGIDSMGETLPIDVVIKQNKWDKFKEDFPEKYRSVTISGQLCAYWNEDGMKYIVKAGGDGITRFYNLFQDSKNESIGQFHGSVVLKKKFDFNTSSSLFLKRMVFKTCETHPVCFEATALRNAAPYFDNIKEGDAMYLKAEFMRDNNGNPPYWRIKARPHLEATPR